MNAAQKDIGIGNGQRACAPIAGGPGARPRRFGPHPQTRSVEADDGTAAGRNGVDAHHGRADPHTADLCVERPFVFAREMAHIGGRAAHVEADELGMPGGLRRAHHADDSAGRPRQDRILALEMMRLGQAARTLHEEKRHARHQLRHAIHIAAQNRRQIGIHHRRIAARHQLHERAHAVGHRNLRKPDLPRQAFGRQLVLDVAVAVNKHDGAGSQTVRERRLQSGAQRRLVERLDDLAAGAHPLSRFDHAFVQQFRKHDVAVEQPRPRLGRDPQRVAEAARDDQHSALALALEQRVGGHRRAHLHAGHALRRDGLSRRQPQQPPNAFHRGIGILRGILRQ